MSAEIHVPFRFRRADAKKLHQLAHLFAGEGRGQEDAALFNGAARAALDGESLDVVVAAADEVSDLLAVFERCGVQASVG